MTAAPETAPTAPGPRRHRRWRFGGLVGLAAALCAASALLVLSPARSKPATPQNFTAVAAWPAAQRAEIPGSLPDGPAYDPVYFLDARTSVGTAPSPDGSHLRLVLRAADGAVRELHRLPMDRTPQYGGFAYAGGEFAWAETVTDARDRPGVELWAANLTSGAAPRRLATDTGAVAFFNSQYDMVINDGRLHWVAVGPGTEPVTEVRSVPLSGGPVTVRRESGAWALSAWPWLVSAGSGDGGALRLRDLVTRREVTAPATGTELVTCSPAWCRVLVLSTGGPARIDLMRPDGTDRQRMAGGTATAAVTDVAVLDRFEVLTVAGPVTAATSGQQLQVYDANRRRLVDVSAGAGMVVSRGGVLWWSTGEDDATVWHSIDLRTA